MMYVYRQCTHEHRCNTVHPKHQQNIVTSVNYVVCMRVCGTDSRVQCVCVADRQRAEHRSRTLFSCNNAITGPEAGDTGERRQQPRHAKY